MPEVVTTPDTAAYLFLALGVFFSILVLFIGSMLLRARNLRKDELVIRELGEE
ncbi:MAG: hypothetical protein ABI835_17700 [Chloroflexota bacterium]